MRNHVLFDAFMVLLTWLGLAEWKTNFKYYFRDRDQWLELFRRHGLRVLEDRELHLRPRRHRPPPGLRGGEVAARSGTSASRAPSGPVTALVCTTLFLVMLFHRALATWLEVHRDLPKLGPRTRRDLPVSPPLVSVVIPARDEEKTIETCVSGVLAQDWPNLEVIVVDDRSSDRTPGILARLAARDPRSR
ncbi:MAG: glycosyltransferase family A protein [bacterium]